MIYLKLFESTKLYEEINQITFNSLLLYKSKNISTKDISSIKMAGHKSLELSSIHIRGDIQIGYFNCWKHNDYNNKTSVIYLEDEWYLVSIVYANKLRKMSKYYKCDQMEGLLECLKEVLI